MQKLPRYLESGVGHVWLVDPSARLVEVYVARDGAPLRVAAAGENDVVPHPPFAQEVDLGAWWLAAET